MGIVRKAGPKIAKGVKQNHLHTLWHEVLHYFFDRLVVLAGKKKIRNSGPLTEQRDGLVTIEWSKIGSVYLISLERSVSLWVFGSSYHWRLFVIIYTHLYQEMSSRILGNCNASLHFEEYSYFHTSTSEFQLNFSTLKATDTRRRFNESVSERSN